MFPPGPSHRGAARGPGPARTLPVSEPCGWQSGPRSVWEGVGEVLPEPRAALPRGLHSLQHGEQPMSWGRGTGSRSRRGAQIWGSGGLSSRHQQWPQWTGVLSRVAQPPLLRKNQPAQSRPALRTPVAPQEASAGIRGEVAGGGDGAPALAGQGSPEAPTALAHGGRLRCRRAFSDCHADPLLHGLAALRVPVCALSLVTACRSPLSACLPAHRWLPVLQQHKPPPALVTFLSAVPGPVPGRRLQSGAGSLLPLPPAAALAFRPRTTFILARAPT